MANKIRILATSRFNFDADKIVPPEFELTVKEFIDAVEVGDAFTVGRLKAAAAARTRFVFTSAQAVKAVAKCIGNKIPLFVCCIGHQTAVTATQLLNCTMEGMANDAGKLADVIIASGLKRVLFACGSQRLPVLPNKLAAAGIKVEEVMVYHTLQVLHKMEEPFDAVLFFSPSAADSFFQNNTLPSGCVAFAIGETTKNALVLHTSNPIQISPIPSKQAVLEAAIAHFNHHNSTNHTI